LQQKKYEADQKAYVDLTKSLNDLTAKLAAIESNENTQELTARIKVMESQLTREHASVEADKARTQAAIEAETPAAQ
jgi:hypothetical protein